MSSPFDDGGLVSVPTLEFNFSDSDDDDDKNPKSDGLDNNSNRSSDSADDDVASLLSNATLNFEASGESTLVQPGTDDAGSVTSDGFDTLTPANKTKTPVMH